MIGHFLTARGRPGGAEDGVNPGSHKVLADGQGLFAHPFRRGAGHRQIADIIAQTAVFDHRRGSHQNAAVVHAGTEVEDRRHAHRLADRSQTLAGEFWRLPAPSARPWRWPWRAARLKNQHVVLDQLFHQGDMGVIVRDPGVVAADDTGHAADAAVDDIVVQRTVGRAEQAAQHVVDGLMAETGDQVGLLSLGI